MNPHLWLRAEQRGDETRSGLTPEGAATLMAHGLQISVEETPERVFDTSEYREAGCEIVPAHSWPKAPESAIIFGLKELPDDGTPLPHRHIMFGHAFKGQTAGARLLERFVAGGGTLLDLEYLIDETGRRVAAFGYWAGFAGAAVAMRVWAAQRAGAQLGPIGAKADAETLTQELKAHMGEIAPPSALIIGAHGRVGTGAADLCRALGVAPTLWDMAETASGGPFPEVFMHDILLNCVLAGPQTPVFFPRDALGAPRALRVIGDIACDPDSSFNPIPVYDAVTTWQAPARRVSDDPVLDIVAIDNLPSLLPLESSQDYAAQLLPTLQALATDADGVWARAETRFHAALDQLKMR